LAIPAQPDAVLLHRASPSGIPQSSAANAMHCLVIASILQQTHQSLLLALLLLLLLLSMMFPAHLYCCTFPLALRLHRASQWLGGFASVALLL
jgi:hypothetical protein